MIAACALANQTAKPQAAKIWAVFFVLTFLHLLRFPIEIYGPGLDQSWQQCLGYFLTHRFQAGVDYIWTYGPLGYFATQSYDGALFWWKYAWEVLVNLMLAGFLTCLGTSLSSRHLQIGYVLVVLSVEPRWDTYYLVAIIWPVVLVLRAEKARSAVLAALGVWLAVLGLVKFTWLLVAIFAWLLLVIVHRRERGRGITMLVSFPLALAGLWLVLGQAPGHFVPYLAGSWQIALGYGEAMATDGPLGRVVLGLSLLLLLGILGVIWIRKTGRSDRALAGCALIGLAVLLAWKHGFTRQPSHDVLFFGLLAVVPFAGAVLAWHNAPPNRLGLALTLVVAGGAVAGGGLDHVANGWEHFADNTRDLVRPWSMRQRCQQRYAALAAEWELPRLAALIGSETVDELSCDQGIVLLNRWNYRPRPIFQSYSAYTPRLLADNAAFFRSERAPRFLLVRLLALDDRPPTSEDGPALLEIFRRYRLVAEESDFLLLKRREKTPEFPPNEVLWEGSVGFYEAVQLTELSGSTQFVHVQIDDTRTGRLCKLLFRPPELSLRIRTEDGKESLYRLIPALASTGFLLKPLLRDNTDIEHWYRGAAVPRVVAFAVEGSAVARACYATPIRVVVENVSEVP